MKIIISISDDHQEWETFGLNCCWVARVDVDSVVVKYDGEFLIVFGKDHSPSDSQFSLLEGLLKGSAKNSKCHMPKGWRFESIGVDKENYLGLGPKYVTFLVKYKKS